MKNFHFHIIRYGLNEQKIRKGIQPCPHFMASQRQFIQLYRAK